MISANFMGVLEKSMLLELGLSLWTLPEVLKAAFGLFCGESLWD